MSSDAKSPFDPSARTAESSLLGDLTNIPGLTLDTVVTVFAIDAKATATYIIDKTHRLEVQEGGLCALNAPYGLGLWDTPCSIATSPVTVTARSWTNSKGRTVIDFSPDLRFAPLLGGESAAVLYIKDKDASLDPTSTILYCGLLSCVDEGRNDPSMITMRDAQGGWVYRRIKHFSGYQVAAGFTGEPADTTKQQQ